MSKQKPITEDEPLAAGDVASLFGVDAKTVTRWANAGKLNSFRTLGGHRRFRRSEIDRLARPGPVTRPDEPANMTDLRKAVIEWLDEREKISHIESHHGGAFDLWHGSDDQAADLVRSFASTLKIHTEELTPYLCPNEDCQE